MLGIVITGTATRHGRIAATGWKLFGRPRPSVEDILISICGEEETERTETERSLHAEYKHTQRTQWWGNLASYGVLSGADNWHHLHIK